MSVKIKVILVSALSALLIGVVSCQKTTAPAPASTSSPTNTAGSSSNNNSSSSSHTVDVTVTGKWEQVGKDGEWQGTINMVGMDGFLWSVESGGSLYKTDPATGQRTLVGEKGSFQHLKLLEGMDHMLWTVEGGDLYKNDPNTGKWELSGEGGGWARTIAMVGLNGILYSIEPDGSLWKTDKSGKDTLVDKGGFKGCTDLVAMDGKLWTIEAGNLYKTDPNTLKWEQVGKEGEWASVSAMESGNKFLWVIDKDGTLFKVDPNGASTMLGERGSYGQTTFLTSLNGKLWTVEGGSLYKTN